MMDRDQQKIEAQRRDPAVVRLWNALLPLQSVISFMNTGAHPDDETSEMLAAMGRRDGFRLSYACSTRGEGGQNVLGREAGADIGMVRTREMEGAAKVLDMVHYWHCESPDDPITDFGFSKSGDETLKKWGHDRLLERFVYILRTERPDIVCPTFLDIPGQHGHHRAMTRAAEEAVVLAADPAVYPEHFAEGLGPWQVKKLYLPAWSGAGDAYDDDLPPPPETVRIDAAGRDPVYGATYSQIGEWSRAYHRTQGMGQWVDEGGEAVYPLHLAWTSDGGNSVEESVADGLPRDLEALADWAGAPELAVTLKQAQRKIEKAIYAWPNADKVGKAAAKALRLVRKAFGNCPDAAKPEIAHRLIYKGEQLSRVLFEASCISVRAEAQATEVAQGGQVQIDIAVHMVDGSPVRDLDVALVVPGGWAVRDAGTDSYLIEVPSDAALSDPYPNTYDPAQANGPLHLAISFIYGDTEVTLTRDLERPLCIVPGLEMSLEPAALVFNTEAPKPLRVRVGGVAATPQMPADWRADAVEGGMQIVLPGQVVPGRYAIPFHVDGAAAMRVSRADYPHIGPVARAVPAHLDIQVIAAKLPDAKVAYVSGGGDRVGYWMRAMGLEVTELDDHHLATGDFSAFDTIVVGIFALRTRPALAAQLSAVHDWVRAGGNLVTLYHRPWDNWDAKNSALAPLAIGKPSLRWRVTDETADVTVLEPEHGLMNIPNTIDPDDWLGWHKERGLYFAAQWDEAYTPLLSMSDPDEKALLGSMLTGVFGKGRHTHTSLILHHQMEKLTPGAFRLMANLVAPAQK